MRRTRAAFWHPCTQMKQLEAAPPLAIACGEGAWLIDPDGRRYFDAISNWWVNLFGHCNRASTLRSPISSAIRARDADGDDTCLRQQITRPPIVGVNAPLTRAID
jgi:glutamate-1-semialdehyde aminotransferase